MDNNQKTETLEKLNQWAKQTLNEALNIRFSDITPDSLSATMPVTERIHQPYGIMHGGASCVLAETLGSTLSYLHIDQNNFLAVGTNINSNHLRAIKSGVVTGTATFIRKGNTMHVSQIEIRDENGHLINHTTMTNTIVPKRKIQD